MARLYKKKYTDSDINLIQSYIVRLALLHRVSFYIEVWDSTNPDADGTSYDISIKSIAEGINLAEKYYDAGYKVVELHARDSSGDITVIYHVERNRWGILFDTFDMAKRVMGGV